MPRSLSRMWARGLLLFLCMGKLQPLDFSILQSTLQLISSGKTFQRVDEPLSWPDALRSCQLHHTDLADLQSLNNVLSIKALYSLTSSTAAWIGLFFNTATQQLSWSSGSVFTAPVWSDLPSFEPGICATLYSTLAMPILGADSCTARKPFICYYDENVGHRLTTRPLSLTTTPQPAKVQLRERTFLRFERLYTWLEALHFCRRHCTDLADLQLLGESDKDALQAVTSNSQEAWIGLYFSAASGARSWSSDLGESIPSWLTVPQMGIGLCAGLGVYRNFGLQVYTKSCSSHYPFICFYDPAIGHRTSAALPVLFLSHVGTTPWPSASAFSLFQRVESSSPDLELGQAGQKERVTMGSPGPISQGRPPGQQAPEQSSGRHFGILKADFTLAAHVDPEESREQLLQEIHQALQLTLGPVPLRLKWVALEDGQQ